MASAVLAVVAVVLVAAPLDWLPPLRLSEPGVAGASWEICAAAAAPFRQRRPRPCRCVPHIPSPTCIQALQVRTPGGSSPTVPFNPLPPHPYCHVLSLQGSFNSRISVGGSSPMQQLRRDSDAGAREDFEGCMRQLESECI